MKALELRDKAKLWLRAKYPQALITHELSVAEYGGALVDVAAILDDHIVGVEIKGEGDSPARLGLQGGMYSRVCRTMHLLADESIRKKCAAALPPGWGEIRIGSGREDSDRYNVCEASGLVTSRWNNHHDASGYGLAPVALAAMPWTKEYPAFQVALGMGYTALPRTKAKCIEYVAANFTLRTIEKAVCGILKQRDWERKQVDAPSEESEAA